MSQGNNSDEELIRHSGLDEAKTGLKVCSRKSFHCKAAVQGSILILVVLVIGLAVALGVIVVRGQLSNVIYASCPDGWIGYLGKCYDFSEDEADWLSSFRNCSSMGATLTTIETVREMGFLLRYKGPIYHWIGLRKEQEKPWEWADGRVFNNTQFDINEGGHCAYLNDVAVMSSWCKTKKNWICSKPNAYTVRKKEM
ncbi:C-type lectin domain family 2 member B-like [Paroedura picta]|uniref:C-type lectin domain family 2 member B-like n=1 Tax=Paroedura picta TaxID=143630 RepID=UPI0040577524